MAQKYIKGHLSRKHFPMRKINADIGIRGEYTSEAGGNGWKYKGQMKGTDRHGFGKCTWKLCDDGKIQNHVFEGYWKNDMPFCLGRQNLPSGEMILS